MGAHNPFNAAQKENFLLSKIDLLINWSRKVQSLAAFFRPLLLFHRRGGGPDGPL